MGSIFRNIVYRIQIFYFFVEYVVAMSDLKPFTNYLKYFIR